MNPAEYKVVVCIRDYMPVVKQLMQAGIPNFSVYDPAVTYSCDRGMQKNTNALPSAVR